MIEYSIHDNKIEFVFDNEYKNVNVRIKIDGYENYLFNKNYEKVANGVRYFYIIPTPILKFCKNKLILFYTIDGRQGEIKIDNVNDFNISLISNSCVGWRTYEQLNMKYNSPTIGNLILDDLKYLKFCEMYDFYSKIDFTFGEIRNNEEFNKQYGRYRYLDYRYPISHHSDVDIHWIHNKKDKLKINENGSWLLSESGEISELHFYNKWKQRELRGRDKDKIFLWSSSEFFNAHGKYERNIIIDRFKKLKGKSIFLTEIKDEEFEDENHIVKYVKEWESFNQLQLGEGGTKWNDQLYNAAIFKQIIESKFL